MPPKSRLACILHLTPENTGKLRYRSVCPWRPHHCHTGKRFALSQCHREWRSLSKTADKTRGLARATWLRTDKVADLPDQPLKIGRTDSSWGRFRGA